MMAGDLRCSVAVMLDDGGGLWVRDRVTFAKMETVGRTIAYSTVSTKAPQVDFWMRKQNVCPGVLLQHMDKFYLVLHVADEGTAFLHVVTAQVAVTNCRETGTEFHGILSEKYVRAETMPGYGQVAIGYVLTVPRSVSLRAGLVVEIAAVQYALTACHELDLSRFEWEITRTEDC